MKQITRRQALRGLAAIGAVAGAGSYFAAGPSVGRNTARHVTKLRIPPLLEGSKANAGKQFALSAVRGTSEFFEGYNTPTLGLNGTYLGPTLRFKNGEQVTIHVENKLGFDTTLHWHGLHIPAKQDGGPHQIIKPGATWSPSFEIKQKAATFWYHSHLLGETGAQVNAGLAGLIIVDDDESATLGLPNDYGVDDIPLVVQDRRFNRDGTFAYGTSMPDTMMGFKGDVILVNGTRRPYLTISRQRTRLRLLNGSNSRIYNFGFEDGRDFVQIGTDGSLLASPIMRRRLQLAPGERAEILVTMEDNSKVFLMSYPFVTTGGGMMGGMMSRMMGGNTETFPVLELRAGKLERSDKAVPRRLAELPHWNPQDAQRVRPFELNMGMMGGMMGRGRMMGRGSGMMGGDLMAINGRPMDMTRIDERVPLGATEIWQITNPSPLAHPFHIHDIQFRVLDRNGRPPPAHEAGLKDTVLVNPNERVRVITKFADFADAQTPYMYHCHILEHEDAGMMGQFTVEA